MKPFRALTLRHAAALSLAIAGLPDATPAQSLVVAAEAEQFADNASAAGLAIEFLGPEHFRIGTVRFGFGAALSTDSEQNSWAGAGVAFVVQGAGHWFVEGSVMPGYYTAGEARYDLGDALEVRSLIGLGYRLNDRYGLSLGLSHISNGGLGTTNPGSNALSLRLRARL